MSLLSEQKEQLDDVIDIKQQFEKLTIQDKETNPEGLHFYNADNAPYRFGSFNDNAKKYLNENGYIAIGNVLNNNEIIKAKSLLWDFIETCSIVERNNIKTWDDGYWTQLCNDTKSGLINNLGISQSKFQWYIRTNKKLLNLFIKIWNVKSYKDLLCSMDGICLFRPFDKKHIEWKTINKWYHIDQNPINKPNFQCYQSYITLLDQNQNTGGTAIIPKSHLKFKNV